MLKIPFAKTFLAAASAFAMAGAAMAGEILAPVDVTDHGLVARVYAPAGPPRRHAALLVLGGSEGGLDSASGEARLLAEEGYVTMAVAFFKAPGLPDQLVNIPLEYFGTALDTLRARADVDPARVGVVGTSKGGEAVLLIASRHPEVKVVVAGVPSSVVWQGINMKDFGDASGSWTKGGKPVPYLTYDNSVPFDGANWLKSIHDMYARSLAKAADRPDAVIPVERIAGPVMLVCGQADGLWPSCPMSEAVVARLKAHGFGHEVQLLSYPGAGHAAFGPPVKPDAPYYGQLMALGGDLPGNTAAREDSWGKAKAFLAAALKP